MSGRMDALKAKEKHEAEIMSLAGVTGIAVGSRGGKPCITVYVKEAKPEILKSIPKVIEGYPVMTEESGDFVAL